MTDSSDPFKDMFDRRPPTSPSTSTPGPSSSDPGPSGPPPSAYATGYPGGPSTTQEYGTTQAYGPPTQQYGPPTTEYGPPQYGPPSNQGILQPPPNNPNDEIGNPSLPLLVAPSVAAGLAALVAGFFGGQITVAVVCWFMAGFVAIGLLALFIRHDITQRARSGYGQQDWAKPLHLTAMVLIVIGVAVTSFRIADWMSRL